MYSSFRVVERVSSKFVVGGRGGGRAAGIAGVAPHWVAVAAWFMAGKL